MANHDLHDDSRVFRRIPGGAPELPNDPTNNHELLFATADRTLLAPYGLDAGGIERVFGQIMTHSVDYADLYFQYSRSEGWSLEEGMVKSGSFNIDQGVGVRAVSGEKTAFAYSDDISLPALESAAQATRAIARRGEQGATQIATRTRGRELYLPQDPLASLADADKVKLLEKLERYAREIDPRISQVMASLAGEYEVVLIARSDGMLAGGRAPARQAVAAGHRRARRPPRAGKCGRRRTFRLRLFHRRRLARLCSQSGAPGRDQSVGAAGTGRHDDRSAGAGLARHPAA